MEKQILYRSPEELKKIADKKRGETSQFLNKLTKKKPVNLDKTVHQLHDLYFSVFDCLDCANCCKSLGPRLTDTDIERLAKFLRIKAGAIQNQYIEVDEDGDMVFKKHPCPFLLTNNYCSVYESRPKACRDYPHTDRKKFYQILEITYKNCETCPMVFEIIEELRNVYK